ncbi:TolC family protein [Sphingobacterium sp. lm-10]|uniref:TolC family protein n=1 Tax=Sphingobacterium sp. lm-10 TaxID=2944904 RepID=UPI0020214BD3|nr:TolC family protein [Sphingobacterium sp. lm-10]MCL7987174.1 TolC family protein [Sphingobacterium sp. lm-10]
MNRYIKLLLVFMTLRFGHTAAGQELDSLYVKEPMDYLTFLGIVGKENIAYTAERFNINIAQAEIETAKIFPDPELEFGWFDNGERRMRMGYGFTSELTWILELGGKRKARIDLARNQTQLTQYQLEDYFRNLRADATLSYLLAVQNRMLLEVQRNSYQQLNQLAVSDSIRYNLGAISQVDARQSKLEAGSMLNEIYNAEAAYKTSLVGLSLLLGDKKKDTLIYPTANFSSFDRTFSLQDLLVTAINSRADLKAALQDKQVSASAIKLAKANRAIDLGLKLGVNYASDARNIIAPTPSFTTVMASIAVPLKFSNNRHGELRATRYANMQSEYIYRQIELEIKTELTQAYYAYQSVEKQIRQFDKGLLTEAKAILDGKVYSYQRGETSLLEVLNAQRTYNEIQQTYYQTLYNYAEALVELERASGIWDINF